VDHTLMFICEQNQRARDIPSSIEAHNFCLNISALCLKQSSPNHM